MNKELRTETRGLIASWMQHDLEMLADYLVQEVEDPRTNIQSILTRHFLIAGCTGERFAQLCEHEFRFAVVMNWVRQVISMSPTDEDCDAIRDALHRGTERTEGFEIPPYVRSTFGLLPGRFEGIEVENYLERLFARGEIGLKEEFENCLWTFQSLWKTALATVTSGFRIGVLEPACGSANDFRYLVGFGLSSGIDYLGFDLCEKNIQNAKRLFPSECFAVGNAFALPVRDRSVDYCIVHDLFEHLSLLGLECALSEMCRTARQGLCLGFFNMWEGDEHIIQPHEQYHWNKLSEVRVRSVLEKHGFEVSVVHIDTMLRWRLGCADTHNPNAYTLLARRINLTEESTQNAAEL